MTNLRLKASLITIGVPLKRERILRLFLYSKNNNDICNRRKIKMSVNKNKKAKSLDNMTAQERQAIYNSSPFFKKKHAEAVAFLKEHPIPEKYLKRQH